MTTGKEGGVAAENLSADLATPQSGAAWSGLLWGALLLLQPLALYLGFLDNPRVFDDLSVRLADLLGAPPQSLEVRIVAVYSFWLNGLLSGAGIPGLRVGNLLVHLANVLLVFVLARALLAVALAHQLSAARRDELAFAAALLFSVHPVATYAVGYLIQRTILLSTGFALLCAWLHLRAQVDGRARYFALAVMAFALSVFSKEHSVMLPAWLAAMSWWLVACGHRFRKEWLIVFAAYAAVALLVVWVRSAVVGYGALYELSSQSFVELPEHPHLVSVATQMVLFFHYLALWLLPNPQWMSIDIQLDLPAAVLPWWGLLGFAAYLGGLLLACRQLPRRGMGALLGLLYLGFALLFCTEFWAIRLSETMVLYRSYLWLSLAPLAVVLLLHAGTAALPAVWAPRVWWGTVVVLALTLGAVSINRLETLSSGMRVWEDAVAKNASVRWPGVSRGVNWLGVAHAERENLEVARQYFFAALRYNPKEVAAYCNLALYYYRVGDMNASVAMREQGRSIQADHPCLQQWDRAPLPARK